MHLTHRAAIRATLATLALLLSAGLSACSSDQDDESAAPLTAAQVATDSAAAMTDVETASFALEQEGAAVPIDDSGQLLFQAADGRIARPASADAIVTVEALGFAAEVGAIAIDGTVWFTNPLTGDWTEAPASFTFDPATLFDPTDGLAGLMADVADTAELLDHDSAPDPALDPEGDGPWHQIRATVPAERVAVLTGGLVAEATTVDAWIDPETDRVAQLRFDLLVGETTSSWRLAITDYDVEVDITAPEL